MEVVFRSEMDGKGIRSLVSEDIGVSDSWFGWGGHEDGDGLG